MWESFNCLNVNFRLLKAIYVHLLVCYLSNADCLNIFFLIVFGCMLAINKNLVHAARGLVNVGSVSIKFCWQVLQQQ